MEVVDSAHHGCANRVELSAVAVTVPDAGADVLPHYFFQALGSQVVQGSDRRIGGLWSASLNPRERLLRAEFQTAALEVAVDTEVVSSSRSNAETRTWWTLGGLPVESSVNKLAVEENQPALFRLIHSLYSTSSGLRRGRRRR